MKNATPLRAIAGKTTKRNSSVKSASAPKTKIADDKKMLPDITVPIQVMTIATTSLAAAFLNTSTNAKKINAVMNLSITFGTNPPGNVENRPEMTPVVTPNRNTFFACGNKRIPINIIVSIKSGFIPPLIPGMAMYNTAPTPINRDIKTRFFVFNSHLSSAFLSFFKFSLMYPRDH